MPGTTVHVAEGGVPPEGVGLGAGGAAVAVGVGVPDGGGGGDPPPPPHAGKAAASAMTNARRTADRMEPPCLSYPRAALRDWSSSAASRWLG